ncbi:MAG TPA: nucleotide exchange factor GrpE [Actinomycetota bacterium]
MSEHSHEPVRVRVTDKRTSSPAEGDEVSRPATGDVSADEDQPEPEDELEVARADAEQHLDDLRRFKAEFENYRKRMAKEQAAMAERASQAVIERLLPILDSFELALINADRTKDYESMVRGVELVFAELVGVLEKEGLRRIEAAHAPFDPAVHEAVLRTGDGDEMVVIEEMRAGYAFQGRVIRPAMVKVGPKT